MAPLVPCKSCQHEINKKSKTCPNCGVKSPTTNVGKIADRFLGFIVLAIITGFLINHCSQPKTPEDIAAEAAEINESCRNGMNAQSMSEVFIKERLKAPSTAKFPSRWADGVTIMYLGDCTSRVESYVDSQNGFGAMIRSRYVVKLSYNAKNNTYTAISVDIE